MIFLYLLLIVLVLNIQVNSFKSSYPLQISNYQDIRIQRHLRSYNCISMQYHSHNNHFQGTKLKSSSRPQVSIESKPKYTKYANITLGLLSLIFLNKYLNITFKKFAIAFPSSLGGLIGIFTVLSCINMIHHPTAINMLSIFLPALNFIRAWLALFFIPPLVVIPLKAAILSTNAAQLLIVIIVGFISSLLTAGITSQFFSKHTASTANEPSTSSNQGKLSDDQRILEKKLDLSVSNISSPPMTLPSPIIAIASSIITLVFTGKNMKRGALSPEHIQTLQQIFGIQSTIASFLATNKYTPPDMKKIVHPVLTTAILCIFAQYLFGLAINAPLLAMLGQYYGTGVGPGDLISSMLGPAIISFGIQLFQYRNMLITNSVRVLMTSFISAVFGLVSSVRLCKVVALSDPIISASTLTRCITSPLALAGANLIGADPTLSALVAVITGLLGASCGSTLLKSILKTKDDITIGLSIGASAHGLGAASVANEPVQFSAAIVSMTLTGLFTIILLSIPHVRMLATM